MKKLIAAGLLLGGLVGCSTSGTSVLVGEGPRHESTDPEAIVLLLEPPERSHTIIALVEGVAATDDYLTKARTEAAALTAMKTEAARIGAHAIVLTGKGSAPYGQTTISSGSASAFGTNTGSSFSASAYGTTTSTTMGWEKITFSGTAIRYEGDAPTEDGSP